MDSTDAFFTHTIVGAPMSVLLGRRLTRAEAAPEGLRVDLGDGGAQLSPGWREWLVLSHAGDPVGQPRLRPGPLRRHLERHALWLALTGLLALAGSAVFWGLMQWN